MKEIIVEHEQSKTTKSIKRLLLAFFSAILITEGTTQWAAQTFELLPQWAEYMLYPTLFLCFALPSLYLFGGRPLTFLVDKLTKSGRTALNTAQLLNNLISTSSVILFSMQVKNGQLYLEWVSRDTLESLLGYTEEEAMQPGWWVAHLYPLDRDSVVASSDKVFQGVPVACDYRFMHKNGNAVWIHDEQKLVLDNSGRPTHMVCIWSDITARKMTEQPVDAAHTFVLHEGNIITDANEPTLCVTPGFSQNAVNDEYGGISQYRPASYRVSERNELEERIRLLGFYDPLTKLPNRRLLRDRIDQAIAASTCSRQHGALLFLDIDRFKILNDTYGHNIGDQLLVEVSQRLQSCLREGDTIARPGGDEFMMILNALDQYAAKAELQVKNLAERIRKVLAEPYYFSLQAGQCQTDTITYHSSASIGAVLFLMHENSTEELMQHADLAMYQAKHSGRDAVCMFDPGMRTELLARTNLEEDLHRGLEEKQFLLYYQPQVDTNGRITGSEALVRWQHPERGMVSPADFIPVAEESGLILPLGLWILETACGQLAAWSARQGTAALTLAVNVSAHQFRQADFVDQVLAVLERTGADPCKLKLELTESLLVDNVEDIIDKMTALKEKGVCFSLDDFGTGYSSLTYLKRLPLDQLKIDQSFVRDILIDPNDAAIAQMIVALAESMGLAVIAEGVENKAQRGFLARQGCHAYQGYLFSHPLTLEQFDEFVSSSTEDLS